MAAVVDPLIKLLSQLEALAATNATLQGQVATLQVGMQATAFTSFARTPAFMGQTDLLNFRKKADLSIYAECKIPVFDGDEHFDVKMETLGPFLKRLHKKATNQGWNDANNPQQIALFNITHNGALITIDITKFYGCIEVTKLWIQCM